jgi:hypothetical protein
MHIYRCCWIYQKFEAFESSSKFYMWTPFDQYNIKSPHNDMILCQQYPIFFVYESKLSAMPNSGMYTDFDNYFYFQNLDFFFDF